jgi:hypothetical protein
MIIQDSDTKGNFGPIKKRKRARKTFCIEARFRDFIGVNTPAGWGSWRRWSRYVTKERRDSALFVIQRKNSYSFIEYRAALDT